MESGKNRYSLTMTGRMIFVAASIGILSATAVVLQPVAFLQPNEQLLLTSFSRREVRNGPQVTFFAPLIQRARKRFAIHLNENQYIKLKDELTGEMKVVAGPKLYFVGPFEKPEEPEDKIVLTERTYVRLLDSSSGRQRLVRGPATVVPRPLETFEQGVQDATRLEEMEYVLVTDTLSGAQRVESGPQLLFPGVHDTVAEKQQKLALKKHEYAKVIDEGTGEIRVVQGPQVLVPLKATEKVRSKREALKLRKHQYVKLIDQASGQVRVERGEALVVPGPTEEAVGADGNVGAVRNAVNVDDETAVLVVSKLTGQQRLVTERGLFFPDKYDEIVEVRELIRVEPHEVAIVRDRDGAYHFHGGGNSTGDDVQRRGAKGDTQGTAFFLQPHHELVTMRWSSGSSEEDLKNNVVRNAKQVAFKVPVSKVDLRAQYAFFEYTVRTSDNVELTLEGTIFWQVMDVPRMIKRTADPKGDVWYHARSALIQAVSSVTLETFMASFNAIVAKAAAMDQAFYAARGVVLHNLEVVRYGVQDPATSKVLQEIIQETTNRINRMQKQKSENEVEREAVVAQIEIEKQRAGLIKEKTANEKLQASVSGESEGARLAQSTLAFLQMLEPAVADEDTRLRLLQFFTEQKTVVAQAQRYAHNPDLTTVIEGGADVKPVPQMHVK